MNWRRTQQRTFFAMVVEVIAAVALVLPKQLIGLARSSPRKPQKQQEAIEMYLAWHNRRRILPIITWVKYRLQAGAA